jgi:sugar O-acyltransferase (sialic acid O-acetyltransferase NeuD family)
MNIPLILVAASGLARETLEAARAQDRYAVCGYVDDDMTKWGSVLDGVKVLGALDLLSDYPDASVMICAGRGADRESIAARLDVDEARYATIVHPSVSVPPSCQVGCGTVMLAGTALTTCVDVRRHVVAMPNVTLTHDDIVEDFATLCAGVALGGTVRVGRRAYIGMSAAIRERSWIGPDAIVGMGAVVLDDVPEGETWLGVPARRYLTNREAGVPEQAWTP